MSEVGAFIKQQRELRGYSLKKLANLCGISDSELLKIEKGERQNPNCKCLCEIARALDTSSLEVLLKAGYLIPSDLPSEPKIKRIEKLSSSETEYVQLFVDFLISNRNGIDMGRG